MHPPGALRLRLCGKLFSPPASLTTPAALVPLGQDFIHLTYEGGDHYNSVRRAGDDSAGPGGARACPAAQ